MPAPHELHHNAVNTNLRLELKELLESQIRAKNCYNIPTLATHKNIPYNCYRDELKALIEQFDPRFADFQTKDSTFAIFARPMDANVNNVPENGSY
jgi:hypothetical protein